MEVMGNKVCGQDDFVDIEGKPRNPAFCSGGLSRVFNSLRCIWKFPTGRRHMQNSPNFY